MQQSNFYCKPAPGERVETTLQVPPDLTAAIHGIVTAPDGMPLADVLVLLFRMEDESASAVLIAQVSTDADGHFAFGNLQGDALYRIKVFQQGKQVRTLELTATD